MKILVLFFAFFSLNALAEVKNVILDINPLLIQNVNYTQFKRNQGNTKYFEMTLSGRKTSWVIHNHAKELIDSLIENPNLKLHLASTFDSKTTSYILSKVGTDLESRIKLKQGLILTAEDTFASVFVLDLISKKSSELIIIAHDSDRFEPQLSKRFVLAGKVFFHSESFKQSQEDIKTAKESTRSSFPPSEEEWGMYHYKLSRLITLFKDHALSLEPEVLNDEFELIKWQEAKPFSTNTVTPVKSHSYSLRLALTDDKWEPLDDSLPKSCANELKKIYERGENLASEVIKESLVPASKLKLPSGQNDLIFYHYTNSVEVKNIAISNQFLEFFKFLRSRKQETWWFYFFYIAEDPRSSLGYGQIQVRVHIKPDALVVDEFEEGNASRFRQKVLHEIKDKYPTLSDCLPPTMPYQTASSIYFLAAEDSGAQLIQYWNKIDLGAYEEFGYERKFFQLMTPDAIEKVELGKWNTW